MRVKRWMALAAGLIVVFALTAVGAGSASAAQWYVNGKKLTKNGHSQNLAEVVKIEENIVISVPATKLAITCKEAKITGESRISGIASMQIEFLSLIRCQTTEPASGCELEERTNKGDYFEASPQMEGIAPEDKLIIAPKTNEDLMEFFFEEEDKCEQAEHALQALLKGQMTLSMPKGREEAIEQTFVGQGTKESPSEMTMLSKEHPAYLTGKFKLKLTSGAKWSFH